MNTRWVARKFVAFAVVMALCTVALFLMFGEYRGGPANSYSAVFSDVSRLKSGDSVRVAGVRVGTVDQVMLQRDKTVQVTFAADRSIVLTNGTRVAVRYLNLIGDRYLELIDGPGSARVLSAGSQIPVDRSAPALDLDLLLGGLKPVIRGLNPADVNALTAALVDAFQGQGGTLESLLSRTSSFTTALADNGQNVQQLIDNMRSVLAVLVKNGTEFSGSIDRLERFITGLAADRDPIGNAIDSLSAGTASLADLLTEARPPLAGTINQAQRAADALTADLDTLDTAITRMPDNYRRLVRIGSYGSFINYYICGLSVRVSDLQGRTVVLPWVKNKGERCGENG